MGVDMITNYVKLIRPEEWVPGFLILVFGYILSGNVSLTHLNLLLIAFICFLSIGSFGFIINDYFDRDCDKRKKENRNPISNKLVGKINAICLSLCLVSLGLSISYIYIQSTFWLFLLSTILLIIYSAHHLRLKEKFALDIIVNSFDLPVLFLIGYLLVGKISFPVIILAGEILILSLTSGLLQEIRDYEADKRSGFTTTIVKLGIKQGINMLRIIILVFIVFFSLTVYNYFSLYLLLLTLTLAPLIKFVYLEDIAHEISSKKLTKIYYECGLIFVFLIVFILLIKTGFIEI